MGIQIYVMGSQFFFCNESMYCISNILILRWCIVAIIPICYGPEYLRIVFIYWGCHTRSFTHCVKLVQGIFSTFEYVKIACLLDNWIIRNRMFLMLFLIICIFFFVYDFVDAFWFTLICINFINDNAFDLSSSVEQTWDKVFPTRKSFDFPISVEQAFRIGIYFAPVMFVLTGYLYNLRVSALIIHFASCLVG